MARIKHLAIVTLDPERLAKFYVEVFGMEILHRPPNSTAVFVTDGYITLALLPQRAEGKPSGINHFGFEIDDEAEIGQRLEAFGLAPPAKRPDDRPYAETRVTDPDGNNIDLSVNGYEEVKPAARRAAKTSVDA